VKNFTRNTPSAKNCVARGFASTGCITCLRHL
jgi:hypothetical protein